MVEGIGDSFVPQFLLSRGFSDALMYFQGGWHDEGSEVCWLENDDVIIVLLALVMVVTLG